MQSIPFSGPDLHYHLHLPFLPTYSSHQNAFADVGPLIIFISLGYLLGPPRPPRSPPDAAATTRAKRRVVCGQPVEEVGCLGLALEPRCQLREQPEGKVRSYRLLLAVVGR